MRGLVRNFKMSMYSYIKSFEFDEKIAKKIAYRREDDLHLVASVIIVTYNTNKKLLKQCLKSLREQTCKNFEILVVDNSNKIDLKPIISNYVNEYIKLKKNYGLSIARNLGIKFAKGEIVIFLDDDAIPDENFVFQHIKAYKEYDIYGLRGKAILRTTSIYNYLQSHYDLGEEVIPYRINLEGNSSFKRDILIEIGGFNPELEKAGGFEGNELTYRIIKKYKNKSKLIYYPYTVIYHDYSNSFLKYIKKRLRGARFKELIKSKYYDILEFKEAYPTISCKVQKENLDLLKRIKLRIIVEISDLILRVRSIFIKIMPRDL